MSTPACLLTVDHETRYDYAVPVETAHHITCLRPLSDAGQQLRRFDMAVEPEPASHRLRIDSFGNRRALFAFHTPHSTLVVRARSEVEVRARYVGLDLASGLTVAQTRERLRYHSGGGWSPAVEFVAPSPFVPLQAELRQWSAASLRAERPLAEAVIDLMHRVHRDFRYAPATTDISTPVMEVFRKRQGVCQDFAHLMLACLRVHGLAARYVSGYLLTVPPEGQAPLVGADASHAWVSVWCPGLGEGQGTWLDLDPTNDCVPAQQHIRVATGRDFGDVTPLRGVIRGGGQHTLLVRVTTRQMPAPADTARAGALSAPR